MPDPKTRNVLALDLGGTKLAAAIVNAGGEILSRVQVPAPRSPAGVVEHARAAMHACALDWADLAAAGLIVPGIYDSRTGCAWAPNLWGDRQVPLASDLAASIPVPIRIASDRSGYVLGESWLGIARGLQDVVFLAVGTGIGAGILSGGRVIEGHGGIAGAVGWFSLRPEFEAIYEICGCWEAHSAGPALARRGGRASAEEVVAEARAGKPEAVAVVEQAADFLGAGIANLISTLNPEMVVLGGGLMQAHDLFVPRIRAAAERWAQPIAFRQCRIEVTALGTDAGLLGAARLALGNPESR